MKKKNKVLFTTLIALGLTTTTLGISGPLIYKRYKEGWSYDSSYIKQFENNDISRVKINNDSSFRSVLEKQEQADINVYFASQGIQAYYNLLRMAMLTKKEVHFGIWKSENSFQRKTNAEYLANFLKNLRQVDKDNEEEIRKNTTVEEFSNPLFWDILTNYENIVKNNPNKKVYIWINVDHIKNNHNILSLLKYSNVCINGIEDSQILPGYMVDRFEKGWVSESEYKNSDTGLLENNLDIIDRTRQYLVSTFYHNVNFFFTEQNAIDRFKFLGLTNMFNFFDQSDEQLKHKEIKDYIFTTRDIQNKRYMTHWSAITGLNWEAERDIVKQDFAQNNKPSLLVFGTQSTWDLNYLIYLADKYADTYNIYYKGHPGSNYNSNWVETNLDLVKKPLKYTDLVTKESKTYTPKEGHIIRALESQIPSEELTTDNVFSQDPLRFDKFAATDFTSTALIGLFNGYNNANDLLEIQKVETNDILTNYQSDDYLEQLGKLISIKILGNYLKTSIKESSQNKKLDDLTSDDFDFVMPKDKKPYLSDVYDVKIISKETNNSNQVLIKFSAKVQSASIKNDKTEYPVTFIYVGQNQ
ncbi:hypothetical protein ACWXVL_01870 [Mycoplasma sp. 128]